MCREIRATPWVQVQSILSKIEGGRVGGGSTVARPADQVATLPVCGLAFTADIEGAAL